MATIDISKTYLDGYVLSEADLDASFEDIEDFLNTPGVLNDDNILELAEAKVNFADSGHSHGSGADGKKIVEANLTFDDATGHTHTGADGNGTKIPTSALEGSIPFVVSAAATAGGLLAEYGTTANIADAAFLAITLTEITTILSVQVVKGNFAAGSNLEYGSYFADGYWFVINAANQFTIYNNTGSSIPFGWSVMGIA